MQQMSAHETSVATDDAFLTIAAAADLLQVSSRTVYRMVTDGVLELVQIPAASGRRQLSRLRRSDVERRAAAVAL